MRKFFYYLTLLLILVFSGSAWAGHQGIGVQTCTPCHEPNLINQHSGFSADTCWRCHASTRIEVIDTIEQGVQGADVFCADCHGAVLHIQDHGTFIADWPILDGVVPGSAPEWTQITEFTNVDPATEEYQVCFKCHSYYGFGEAPGGVSTIIGPSGLPLTDQAMEFNVNNDSFHWVVSDQGAPKAEFGDFNMDYVYQMMPRYDGFPNDLLRQVGMRCSDCHEFLDGADPRMILKVPAGSPFNQWEPTSICTKQGDDPYPHACDEPIWCFNCHAPDFDNTGFWDPDNGNLHTRKHPRKGYCMDCHIRIPHGWQVPHLLKYRGLPTSSPYQGGSSGSGIDIPINSPNWNHNQDWNEDGCGSHQNCDAPT